MQKEATVELINCVLQMNQRMADFLNSEAATLIPPESEVRATLTTLKRIFRGLLDHHLDELNENKEQCIAG